MRLFCAPTQHAWDSKEVPKRLAGPSHWHAFGAKTIDRFRVESNEEKLQLHFNSYRNPSKLVNKRFASIEIRLRIVADKDMTSRGKKPTPAISEACMVAKGLAN